MFGNKTSEVYTNVNSDLKTFSDSDTVAMMDEILGWALTPIYERILVFSTFAVPLHHMDSSTTDRKINVGPFLLGA